MTLPPLQAEPIFHLGPIAITNAMLNGWIAVAAFVALALVIRLRGLDLVPKRFQNAVEGLVEFLYAETRKVTGDEARARAFFPIVASLFLFILFSNWLGLLPGTGTIGVWSLHDGHEALFPFLRPAASDLNFTLAIAVFAVLASHAYGFARLGFANHFSKFVNLRGIWRGIKKGPMAAVIALIEFGVGIIEIVSEIAKVASLSLRLFGNVFAGEVLLTVMLGLFSFFVPIPFMLLEILVGAVQATVFALLTLAYLTVATEAHGDHEEEHDEAHEHAPAHA